MAKPRIIEVTTTVSRHMPQFSRLTTIPSEKVAPWKLHVTTVVEGTINGVEMGRRSMKRWDERDCWWIDLPDALCKKVGITEGDKIDLVLRVASEDLPDELAELINRSKLAKARWDQMMVAQQRMLREEIYGVKSSDARSRRAAKYLT
jgi:hypothetical protein